MSQKKYSLRSGKGVLNAAFDNDSPQVDLEKEISKTDADADVNNNFQELSAQSKTRPQWNSSIEFLLSCISMSVGLGNVWRFPYIGVGFGGMMVTVYTTSFAATVMGLTIFYFCASFQKSLPWSECDDDWVNLGRGISLQCNESDLEFAYDVVTHQPSNISISQLYFENEVLKQKNSIDDGIGVPEWRQTLCLLLAWITVWGSLIKGIASSGKVAYFTALFPYVVLIIMLIRGVTLPGAWDGIVYFIEPQWEKMLDPIVWYEAVGQCFFSLGTGFGTIIMFSSYNPFRHNIYRDAWIISGVDTFTSILAGFTVFAVLGSLAHNLGVKVEDVVTAGPGLAFISYPAAIAKFDWLPQLFSVLFYLMLFTLGLGTVTSVTSGLITIVTDSFPKIARLKVTTIICMMGFLGGLIFVTPGGQFMVELFSHYGTNFPVYVMGTLETVAIAWIYGLQNILKDIEFMLGVRVGWYFKLCWGFVIPVGLPTVLVYSLVTEKRLTFDGHNYPDIAIAFGWLLGVLAIVVVPIYSLIAVMKSKSQSENLCNQIKEKIVQSSNPKSKWGPSNPIEKRRWIEFKKQLQVS